MFLNVNSTNQPAAATTRPLVHRLLYRRQQAKGQAWPPKTQVHAVNTSTSVPLYSQRTLALFSLLACFGPFQDTLRRMTPFVTQARRMEHFVSQLSCQHVLWNLQTSTVMLNAGMKSHLWDSLPTSVMSWHKPLGGTNNAPTYVNL